MREREIKTAKQCGVLERCTAFENDLLKIKDIVSDSNDDITDPAGKFYEALEKLIEWNRDKRLDTLAMKKFQEISLMKLLKNQETN